MEKPTRREIFIFSVAALVVFSAWFFRMIGLPRKGGANVYRAIVYPLLFIYWGFTLNRRLTHPQVRRYCLGIASLLVFWFLVRSFKYSLASGYLGLLLGPRIPLADGALGVIRQLWYLYYLPMIFIPTLSFLTALAIGLPETKRFPKQYHLLLVLAAVLVLAVLTNDLHQLVFAFPDNGTIWSDEDYSYTTVYYFVAVYEFLCAAATFVTLAVKRHRIRRRRWVLFPCVPVLLSIVYLLIYAIGGQWIHLWFGDMTAVCCVLYASTIELCIQCGLITSNNGYGELFEVSTLSAKIADRNGEICLEGMDSGTLTKKQILEVQEHPVLIGGKSLLKSKPIRFGHVLWKEDISELTEAIEDITENMQELSEQSRIHQENMEAEQEILALQEKNRTTDLLHQETSTQLEYIDGLFSRYEQEADEAERRRLLAEAAVVGAYIKRYGNLLLISERLDRAEIADLTRCFEETFLNLELLDVECLCSLPEHIRLYTRDMLRVYRTFELMLEDCMSGLQHVWVNGRVREDKIRISMEFVCDADLLKYASKADAYSFESGTSRFTFLLQKGGEGE